MAAYNLCYFSEKFWRNEVASATFIKILRRKVQPPRFSFQEFSGRGSSATFYRKIFRQGGTTSDIFFSQNFQMEEVGSLYYFLQKDFEREGTTSDTFFESFRRGEPLLPFSGGFWKEKTSSITFGRNFPTLQKRENLCYKLVKQISFAPEKV